MIKAKDVEIKIQSMKESGEETLEIAKKIIVEGYRPKKPIRILSFTSVELAGKFLTPKRLEVLQLIRKHNPESIYALAKLAGRNVVNVGKDVKELKKLGIVMVKKAKKNNRNISKPSVEFDEIKISIPLAAKA